MLATGAMMLAIAIALVKMWTMEGNRLAETSMGVPGSTGLVSGMTALMNLVFAFGGQVIGAILAGCQGTRIARAQAPQHLLVT